MQRSLATARALLVGVLVSCVLLGVGLLMQLPEAQPRESLQFAQLRELPSQLNELSPETFLHLGLLVLMATPLMRIVVLLAEFVRSGEVAFATMAIGVLLLLGVSVFIGLT